MYFIFKMQSIREGFKKKKEWSFAKPGGGGASEGGEKTKLLLWNKYFFREYLESSWDPQNMFYTWSGASEAQILGKKGGVGVGKRAKFYIIFSLATVLYFIV